MAESNPLPPDAQARMEMLERSLSRESDALQRESETENC